MTDKEIKDISSDIIKFRNELDGLNKVNLSGLSQEVLVDIEVKKAKAKIGLRRAKQQYEDYIQDEVIKQ